MATNVQVSWIQFTAPAPAPGVPVDPADPLFGKRCGCGGCKSHPAHPKTRKSSRSPIRYGTGEIVLTASDLGAGGFGVPWGHTRSFASRLTAPTNVGNGTNWQIQEWT
jgi:hypothetical protein